MFDNVDKAMGDSDRVRLDQIRINAHENFILFQTGSLEMGIDTLIILREGFRLLEFSMKKQTKKAVIKQIRKLENELKTVVRNENKLKDYGRRFTNPKIETITKNMDELFSRFYEIRQKAGMGVKINKEGGRL